MAVHAYHLANGETRWRYVFDLASGPGERAQHKRSGFRDQTEAEHAEEAARKALQRAKPAVRGTVAAVLRAWVDSCEADLEVTSSTWYRAMVETYVIPHVGEDAMTAFDVDARNRLYAKLRKRGGRSGAGLSDSTVRGVHKTLSAACTALGIKHEGVRVPKARKGTGRHGVWTGDQSSAFLLYTRQDRLFAAWALAVVCGLRRGELAGLRWRDIDFDEGTVRVRMQRAVPNGGGVITKAPKGTSIRDIPIGALMVTVLKVWQAIWRRERAEAGERWQGDDHVFVYDRGHSRGRTYHPSYFTHRFPVLCRAAGVPVLALHDARHTSSTVAATNGVDIKSLQARMGHSDAKILTEIYLHLVGPAARAAADTIEGAMLRH